MILSQEYTVCFQVIKEEKTKLNKYGDARHAWVKFSRKFETTTGYFKTIPCKKFAKCKLNYVTRDSTKFNTKINIYRGDLQKLDMHIKDT